MEAFLPAMGILVFLFPIVFVVFYVLKSMGLSALAANRGIENPWLAWIPVADLYILGLLVGEMEVLNYHLDNLGLWCPVIVGGGIILSGIPVLGFLISIAASLFFILLTYKLFAMYTHQAILFTVLSVLLGLFAIFIFVIRNNELLASNPFTLS